MHYAFIMHKFLNWIVLFSKNSVGNQSKPVFNGLPHPISLLVKNLEEVRENTVIAKA